MGSGPIRARQGVGKRCEPWRGAGPLTGTRTRPGSGFGPRHGGGRLLRRPWQEPLFLGPLLGLPQDERRRAGTEPGPPAVALAGVWWLSSG